MKVEYMFSSIRPARSTMKVHPLFLALSLLATTARCVSARSWVDTVDPSVYAQAVIDPARVVMSIEADPFEPDDGDKEIPGVTSSPTLLPTSAPTSIAKIETPECTENQVLHVIRLHDSWGDGWGGNNMTITKIEPTMISGDVSTTSRSHVVSISQTTYMEEGVGEHIFHGTLEDGYNEFVYICMEIGTCFNIDVDGEGDWQDEIKWDISDASTCTGSAESCYEEVEDTYAKGIAPSECRFSVPDENGLFKCPFSCKLYTEAPSFSPSDQPSASPSGAPSDAPSLVPVSNPTLDEVNTTAFGKSAQLASVVPSASIVPSAFANASTFPSDAPSLAPVNLAATGRRPSASVPSYHPSEVPSYSIPPSRAPSIKPSTHPITKLSTQPFATPIPTITTGHVTISMDDPELHNAMMGDTTTAPTLVSEPSSKPTEFPSDEPSLGAAVDDRIVATYDYEEGQRVWSAWMGMPEMYEGVVDAVNTDTMDGSKTYNVTYIDDGSFEANVGPDLLYPIELTETELKSRPAIVEEQRVQARFAGDIYWFEATVTKDYGNGTYALLYNDGDDEGSVVSEYIRFDYYTDGTPVVVEESFMDHLGDTVEGEFYLPSPSPSPTLQSK